MGGFAMDGGDGEGWLAEALASAIGFAKVPSL